MQTTSSLTAKTLGGIDSGVIHSKQNEMKPRSDLHFLVSFLLNANVKEKKT